LIDPEEKREKPTHAGKKYTKPAETLGGKRSRAKKTKANRGRYFCCKKVGKKEKGKGWER